MPSERPMGEPNACRPSVSSTPETSPLLARSLAIVCQNLFDQPSDLLVMGRFELLRTLGHGGMGIAYEAYDPLRRERVALKTLHQVSPGGLYQLKREFRALARLSHPNLVALHELSVDDEQAFFTMELVNGRDLTAHLREGIARADAPPEARLRAVFMQLCAGVQALHEHGKLHRDLKPSNVLVTPAGRVVLLDFGLVHDTRGGGADLGGTPAYMAPEQRRGEVSPRSDWYAVGRILEDALYGPGAPGRTKARAQPSVPTRWASLCTRLLSVDPARRPGFEEIAAIVHGTGARWPTAGRATHSDPFVGRTSELRALKSAFSQSHTRPVLVSVHGASGIGKSTLIERFLDTIVGERPALVLRGCCHERESVPYKALDSIVDDLTRHLLAHPAALEALTDADRDALAQLFPVLRRLPALAATSPSMAADDLVDRRTRSFSAFRRLLCELVRGHALVLFVDDAQWSDTDSGLLLSAVLSDDAPPPLLLVMNDRAGGSAADPALRELERANARAAHPPAHVRITLGPLSASEAAQLAHALVPIDPTQPALAARMAEESRGNPLLLNALMRWATADHARRAPELSIDALLAERLQALDESASALLRLVVLAGGPIPMSLVVRTLSLSEVPYAALDQLRAHRLVHTRQCDALMVETDHAAVAAAVRRRIARAELPALHLRLARAIEEDEGSAPELLVNQYVGAERPHDAARHARRAAEIALAGLAFARAAALYRRALDLGAWDVPEQIALNAALARALEHAGDWRAAVAAYLRAASLSDDPRAAVRFQQFAAEHLTYNGQYDEAERLLRRGYDVLGLRWPNSRRALVFATLQQLVPARVRLARFGAPPVSREVRRARADFLSDAGRVFDVQDIGRGVYNALLCFAECDQLDDPRLHARTRGARGLIYGLLPFGPALAHGLREMDAACRTAEALGDTEGLVHLQRQRAMLHYLGGQPRSALAWARRAEAGLRTLPRRPIDLDWVTTILGLVLLDLGELRALRRCWSPFVRAAHLRSEVGAGWLEAHPAHLALLLAADDCAQARALTSAQHRLRDSAATLRWAYAAARAELAIYEGDGAAAVVAVERDEAALFGAGHRVADDQARLLRARALLSAAEAERAPAARHRLLRRAAAEARGLARRRGRMANGPIALLLAGLAYQAQQPARALRALAYAHARAQAAEHKLLAASVRLCRGALIGGASGAALQRSARADLEAEEIVQPVRWVAWTACGFQGLLGNGEERPRG